jgi:glutaredoxin-like protein
MTFISGENANTVSTILKNLEKKVKIILFTQEMECQFCRDTKQLLQELGTLSNGNIIFESFDFINDQNQAKHFGIDKIPATVILNEAGTDFGIRFYGIPSGYEFSTLLEDIQMISKGKPEVSDDTLKAIHNIINPLRLQVFVTPTCPYCPGAVFTAHKLAMLNENITADMVEATEFPHLANKYQVYGVPRTMIGEFEAIEGALPEQNFVQRVLDAYRKIYPDN